MKITVGKLRQIISEVLTERRRMTPRQRLSHLEDDVEDEKIDTEARLDHAENDIEELRDILNMVTTEIDRADLPGMAPVSPKLRHQSRMGARAATGLSMANPGTFIGGTGPERFGGGEPGEE
jgi:hypothetical protein